MAFNMLSGMKNIGKFVSIANQFRNNPKGAINQALGMLEKKNPNTANMIREAIKSNKNPAQFIQEQAKQGNINKSNLQDLKSYYRLMQMAGMTEKVPDSVWNTVETAINTNGGPNTNNSGFSGF